MACVALKPGDVGYGVSIVAFGRFSIVVDGRDRTAAFSPRIRRCFAHLALGDAPVERELLAARLWPDADRAQALGSLRRRLHELGAALAGIGLREAIEVARDRVSLASWAALTVDVARYAILSRDPARAAQAAELYREPVFPGIDDDAIEHERRRLHRVQLELLTRLLDSAVGRGDAAAIAQLADAIAHLDPLNEQTIGKAATALAALGETDRSRRVRERLERDLREEIGEPAAAHAVDLPSESSRRLLQRLIDRGDVLRGARAGEHFDEIESAYAKISAALDSAITNGSDVEFGTRAAAALSRFLFERGHAVDAAEWFDAAIARLAPSTLRAEAMYLRAMVGRNLGNDEQNLPAFEEAIAALRVFGEELTLAKALLYGSNAARMTARVSRALEFAGEALSILERLDDAYLVAFAHSAIGAARYALGELGEASSEFELAHDGFAQARADDDASLMLVNIGRCALAAGDLEAASTRLQTARALAAKVRNAYVAGHAEVGLAIVSLDRADVSVARKHVARAAELAIKGSDLEISVIAVEAAAELFLALGETTRARDALAAADGVRAAYLITRAPTEHTRAERVRDDLARRGLAITAQVASAEVMMRSLLQSVARSYREG